jgi:hypothetical protein
MMMKHLLTAIACFFALSMSAQVLYNPDVNGDGCITVTDVLGLLSIFDTCQEGTTLYYFHDSSEHLPFTDSGPINVNYIEDQIWWITDANGEWHESADFAEYLEWTLANQGQIITYGPEELPVMAIDSVLNVSVPLSESIPNGSIVMPSLNGGVGHLFLVINQQLDFPFLQIPVFYSPQSGFGGATQLIGHEFEWNNEMWTLYQMTMFSVDDYGGYVFNVTCFLNPTIIHFYVIKVNFLSVFSDRNISIYISLHFKM